jgi:cellobiose transport system substrate-binding protein
VVALVTAGAVAGCSSGGGSSDKNKNQKITLSIGTFGTFGYKEDKPAIDLLAEYTKQHPNIKIVQHKLNSDPHHQQLAQHLAAGSGVDDIEAIEEGYIAQFKAHPQQFVNLLDMGAGKLKDNWASWKWNQSMTADGKAQIGLGTDVGPLAMCYRTDLFAQAGLPTDRQAVSALWPSWQDYINAGKTFVAKVPSSHWVDAATNTYNTILMQQGDHTYLDKKNAFVMSSNPSVKKAWDITMQMINAKESANLAAFQDPWNAGFKNGAFATIACPSWMVGYIQNPRDSSRGGCRTRRNRLDGSRRLWNGPPQRVKVP